MTGVEPTPNPSDAWSGGPGGEPPKKGSGRGLMWAGFFTGAIGLLAAALMAGVLVVSNSSDKKAQPVATPTGMTVTSDGFIVEPVASIGPDAFTASVVTDDGNGCDKAALIRDLEGRPEALAAWAGVLGIATSEVATYVESLESSILTVDTKVTNHGLRNGSAYPRPSVLPAGTQVLLNQPTNVPVPSTPPGVGGSPRAPETPTPSSSPGSGTPVTRCRCGNPLLPPYSDQTEQTPTASPSPSASASPSATARIGRSPTRSASPSASASPSRTASPSSTKT